MAVTINQLKYIPDLPAAAVANGVDLLHISQNGNDKQLSITALLQFLVAGARPVGSLFMSGVKGRDPNKLFPGQTWTRHGAGRTLRVCADDESNLGQNLGQDNVTLTVSQMPIHNHGAGTLATAGGGNHTHSGQTSAVGDHTHGAWTGGAGGHNHQGGMNAPGGQWSTMITGTDNDGRYKLGYTSDVGDHAHGVGMSGSGAHNHSFTTSTNGGHTHTITGGTANNGGGQAFSIVPNTIIVGCWVRTA